LLTAGCTRLAPGDLKLIARDQSPAPRVYLIRGYLDWYSTGMDQLSTELKSAGVDAAAFREEQWGNLSDALIQHDRHPLVLIGFSYGADDAILIARRLNDRHLPVDLLITIDPVTPATVPPNVARCVNFYQPNGWWDMLPWLRGVPLQPDPGITIDNINIRNRPDLNQPGTSHGTIAANPNIHREIAALIASVK
jgi:pimeloyl-ACP methyl ester carboxylesterase